MEDSPHYVAAKAFLQTLWSEVLWKAKRDPSSDNFDELDMFVERHKAFFDTKILERFSYEKLFEQHFPRRYKKIKFPGISESEWRQKFLHACKDAYKTEAEIKKENRIYDSSESSDSDENNISGDFAYIPTVDSNKLISLKDPRLLVKERELEKNKKALWIAVKNHDLTIIQSMVREGKVSRKDLDNEDDVENMTLREFALHSGFQEVLDAIFESVVAPPLRKHEKTELRVIHYGIRKPHVEGDLESEAKLCDEDLLCEALRTHQSLTVIRQCCEKVNVKEKMLSTYHGSWLQYACEHAYLEAAQFFVDTYQLPVTQRVLDAVCIVGNLAVLKDFLPRASGEKIDINRLCDWACQEGHLPLVKYFIEEMKVVAGPDEANFQEFVFSASARGHASVVKYLLEKYPHKFGHAFKNGHAEVVEYVLNFMEKNFPRKTDDEKIEWMCWLDEQLGQAYNGYLSKGDDFNLKTFKYLLDKGADVAKMLQDEKGLQLLEKLARTFYADTTIPPELRKMLTNTIEESKESDPVTSKMLAILLNALEDPTPENYAALESKECKAYFFSEPVREGFDQLFRPFVNARNPNVSTQQVLKEEEHSSRAEIIIDTFIAEANLVPVTPQNIDTVTLGNTVMGEWAELLRTATRNPTTANWNAVYAFKAMYEARDEQGFGYDEELIEKCNGLYEKCKVYETSPLMMPSAKGMTRHVLSHVFFKLSDADRKAVRVVSRKHQAVIDDLEERTYKYMYPLSYERMLHEIKSGQREAKVDWKAELKRAEKLLSTHPNNQLEALFRVIRDPSRDIQAVKEIVRSIVFGVGGNSVANEFDALENITLFQCARRIGFKEALVAIFEEICITCKDSMSDFLAAIRCYQSVEVLESCYAVLDSNADDFKQECRQVCLAAIESDNLGAVKFLVERKVMGEKVIDINGVDNGGRTLLSRACEKGWVEIAWYLIAQGANVDGLSRAEQVILIRWTFDNRSEEFQRKAKTILEDRVFAVTRAFSISAEDPPTLVVDDDMSHAELVKRKRAHAEKLERYEVKKKLNEHKRPIYLAAQALLKVLRDPQSSEAQDELKTHIEQLEGEALKSIYELCKPFLQRPEQPSEVPLPPSPKM